MERAAELGRGSVAGVAAGPEAVVGSGRFHANASLESPVEVREQLRRHKPCAAHRLCSALAQLAGWDMRMHWRCVHRRSR